MWIWLGFCIEFFTELDQIYERGCITLVVYAAVTRVTMNKETIAGFLCLEEKAENRHLGIFSRTYEYFFL